MLPSLTDMQSADYWLEKGNELCNNGQGQEAVKAYENSLRLRPGENQTMDCSIVNDSGLCGIYRLDIGSGGNVWSLFANCDGTNTPQFQIYQDCTEAWAAFNASMSAPGSLLSVPSFL